MKNDNTSLYKSRFDQFLKIKKNVIDKTPNVVQASITEYQLSSIRNKHSLTAPAIYISFQDFLNFKSENTENSQHAFVENNICKVSANFEPQKMIWS